MKKLIVESMPMFLFKIFAGPYLAGEGVRDVVNLAQDLFKKRGIYSTLDLLGEDIKNEADAALVKVVYEQLIEEVKALDYVTLSLKPTSLGIDISEDLYLKNLRELLIKADKIPLTIDMEDARYTDRTLKSYMTLLPIHQALGTVIQSRLKRSQQDILNLPQLPKSRIRLCIGIYNEASAIAFTEKSKMKQELLQLLKLLLEAGHFAEIATHDEIVIENALKIISVRPEYKNQVEFQMLYGVSRYEIQQKLVNLGFKVRLYLPFATEWKFAVSYLKRRLYENPQLAVHTLKNLIIRR